MKTFMLAPCPGTAVLPAMEVVVGETGANCALPLLSQRGIWGSDIARTAALLHDLPIASGPRGWQLVPRPQQSTRRLWRQWEADLADFELGLHQASTQQDPFATTNVPRPDTTLRFVGPWTLAAALEMPNGHRAITDAGAARDIRDCLHAQLTTLHTEHFTHFVCSEPVLHHLAAGTIPGAHDFETIPARNEEQIARMLSTFADLPVALYTAAQPMAAQVARLAGLPGAVFEPQLAQETATLDAWGFALAQGVHPIFLIDACRDARECAIGLARFVDQLQLPRELLIDATVSCENTAPTLLETAPLLARAVTVAEMLQRDAGDL